ncbi:MAG: metallophosphoesterase, partial [Alphaproteobacteria bacterium]|nr:metallophosphoesterase [Alphaproteobacteria bacterium]
MAEDTLYYYSVAGGPEHTFRTPPLRGNSNFTIYAEADIGDSATYPLVGFVQSLIAEGAPRFVLVPGDLTYGNKNGDAVVDQHFNDVMLWSQDAAYMPTWGNHEWKQPTSDDLRNYKGRFDFPNPQTSPNAPPEGCCGEDWYWFDYGNVRFIIYPELWSWTLHWTDWAPQAEALMAEAETDPEIDFIVTYGHRPAYSSGHEEGIDLLRDILDSLGANYSKYVLNINGHSHDYERTLPQNGVVHITVGTGGSSVGGGDETCRWSVCPPPSWSAFRAVRNGALRLNFSATAEGKAAIDGSFICGPASPRDDVSCVIGEVIDSFSIGPNLPPESAIDSPFADLSITAGGAVLFEGFGMDPDGDLPLSFLWDFDGGAANQTVEDPGSVIFANLGVYTVTFTVIDSLGRADPTPDSRIITVTGPGGTITAEAYT